MQLLNQEIEYLKKQLTELIEHGYAFSDEVVVQTSQKLDALINYDLLQQQRQARVISYRYFQKSSPSPKRKSAMIIKLR